MLFPKQKEIYRYRSKCVDNIGISHIGKNPISCIPNLKYSYEKPSLKFSLNR